MIVYVARHGETDWNRAGRYQGQRESDLTPVGRLQAAALARALAARPIDAIVSSPLRRCTQTAAELSRLCDLPVRCDDRLSEIAHGTWEGRLREEIEQEDASRYAAWRLQPDTVSFPGGESLRAVLERWRAFADSLTGNAVAVYTHDVLVRLAILDASQRGPERLWEPRVLNGAYAHFEVESGIWHLVHECVDAHLEGLLIEPSAQAL